MPPATGELARKVVHVAAGGLALLLRDLPWWAAIAMATSAFLFNWRILPWIGGRWLWRESERAEGLPRGILIYPLSVLGLILAFPGEQRWMAAALWGILAAGDGMAALLGQAVGGPRLPWNPRKGWAGSLAFVVAGTVAASLLAAWTLRLPPGSALSTWTLRLMLPLALICALVESLPTTLDDNLTVPLVGALVLPLLVPADLLALFTDAGAGRRLLLGASLCGVLALLAWAARALDEPGAVSAAVIGTAIVLGLGLPALALMIGFFALGSAATRIGLARKLARGIAQAQGGRRGWRSAWANGAVPAFLALLGGSWPAGTRGLLTLGYAAAVAAAAADTCSSEIGKAHGRSTRMILSLRPAAPGTEGAVSLAGTLAGFAGAWSVSAIGAGLELYTWSAASLAAAAGFAASLAESAIGPRAQRRGWMGQDLLNVFNTAAGAALALALAWLANRPAS